MKKPFNASYFILNSILDNLRRRNIVSQVKTLSYGKGALGFFVANQEYIIEIRPADKVVTIPDEDCDELPENLTYDYVEEMFDEDYD